MLEKVCSLLHEHKTTCSRTYVPCCFSSTHCDIMERMEALVNVKKQPITTSVKENVQCYSKKALYISWWNDTNKRKSQIEL